MTCNRGSSAHGHQTGQGDSVPIRAAENDFDVFQSSMNPQNSIDSPRPETVFSQLRLPNVMRETDLTRPIRFCLGDAKGILQYVDSFPSLARSVKSIGAQSDWPLLSIGLSDPAISILLTNA